MKRGGGLLLIFLCAFGIIAYRRSVRARAPGAHSAHARPALARSPSAARTVPLFADPGEAGTTCVCGRIFEVARAARARGVNVREIDPDREQSVARKYRVTVAPTLLVLDGTGCEVARHEGESGDVLTAIQTDLGKIPAR